MKKIISWVEVPAIDIKRAVGFYNSLLDVELEINDFGSEQMACFPNNEGAISKATNFKPSPNGVLVSLSVSNIEKKLKVVSDRGGSIITGRTKIQSDNHGFFAVIIDSEGNKIGLYED